MDGSEVYRVSHASVRVTSAVIVSLTCRRADGVGGGGAVESSLEYGGCASVGTFTQKVWARDSSELAASKALPAL